MEMTPVNILALIGAVSLLGCVIAALVMLPRIRALWPGFKQYRHLLATMVSRDVKVKYRRSVLGLLWSILNPLMMMAIVTLVFSNFFRFEIDNFPVYYIVGITIFSFVSDSTTASMNSVLGNATLIKKVYIPKYIFPLQKLLFALVNLAFSLIAIVIVYLVLQMPFTWTMLLLVVPVFYAFIFSLGLSLILSSAVVFFRDTAHLYSIFTIAWMYLTPIFYPFTLLPEIAQVIIYYLNPLLHFVSYSRNVLMYNTIPGIEENLACVAFALITLVAGVIFFKKTQDKFILHI